jgi:cytochrome b561
MSLPNGSIEAYSPAAKWLHWLTALGVFGMIPVGFYMVRRGAETNFDALTNQLYSSHKLTGFLLIWLIGLRIVYRVRKGAPAPVPTLTPLERIASGAVHHLLYVMLAVTPLLGWAGASAFGARDVFGLFSLPPLLPQNEALGTTLLTLHGYAALTMVALIAAHLGGALMHGVLKQDGVMNRMIGWWPLRR